MAQRTGIGSGILRFDGDAGTVQVEGLQGGCGHLAQGTLSDLKRHGLLPAGDLIGAGLRQTTEIHDGAHLLRPRGDGFAEDFRLDGGLAGLDVGNPDLSGTDGPLNDGCLFLLGIHGYLVQPNLG